ncbi:MAG TPA: hypothetical protein VM536_22800 [Chloroflexia bacterium]|nr:hypothetical protein [Chloroflexia bacterium]
MTIRDFCDRFRDELPARIHSRDVSEGGGPEWHRGFTRYISDGERGQFSSHVTDEQDHCNHPTLRQAQTDARDCAVCEGTGLRVVTRHLYRFPVKRSLWKLHAWKVPAGRPPFDTLLWALGCADGDLGMTAGSLAPKYPRMADPVFARTWTMTAISCFQRVFREEAPAKVLRKSESQSIAEAA